MSGLQWSGSEQYFYPNLLGHVTSDWQHNAALLDIWSLLREKKRFSGICFDAPALDEGSIHKKEITGSSLCNTM